MNKGIYQGCFPAHIDMASSLQMAAELGFDGFEVALEDPQPLTPEALEACTSDIIAIGRSVGMATARVGAISVRSTDSELREAGRLAAAAGIRVHSIATMMGFFYPISSPVKAIRESGIDVLLKMLRAAEVLGAKTLLVIPGLVTPSVGYREAYERSQAVLRDLAVEAQRLGVALAIETVWNRFLLSPLEMARFLDEIGSDAVGAYVDVANVLRTGYPQDWLRTLGGRVKGVHFKDFRRDVDTIDGFTHLLHGDVDWPAVREALAAIGYNGYVTIEVAPLATHPEKGLRDAKASLDLILG